jgi:hypothetical protein
MRSHYIFDVLGIDHDIGRQVRESQAHQIAVLAHGVAQVADLVSQIGKRMAEQEALRRSWRQFAGILERGHGRLLLALQLAIAAAGRSKRKRSEPR